MLTSYLCHLQITINITSTLSDLCAQSPCSYASYQRKYNLILHLEPLSIIVGIVTLQWLSRVL